MPKRLTALICMCLYCLMCLPAAFAQEEDFVPLYTGVLLRDIALREEPVKEAKQIGQLKKGEKLEIAFYLPEYVYVRTKKGLEGYILRQHVGEIVTIDPENTLPYAAVVNTQAAIVSQDTKVYKEKDEDAEGYCDLTRGSEITLLYIVDGWGVVPYHRQIGYVHLSKLTDLTPVSPTVSYAQSGDMIAAFTSYYSVDQTEMNIGRMINIDISCDYISMVLQPEESFSFNGIAGPYTGRRGYMPAPILVDGTTIPGYGGGTCQVSSTLYNVLLQLPEGIEVTRRRPHGPSGARYLPIGADAAVGNESLDLAFTNKFPFPIEIYATAQDGALFIAILKA